VAPTARTPASARPGFHHKRFVIDFPQPAGRARGHLVGGSPALVPAARHREWQPGPTPGAAGTPAGKGHWRPVNLSQGDRLRGDEEKQES